MFVHDHRRDFDAVLAATEPFALVRFGDGEAALLSARAHKAAAGEWIVRGPTWLQAPLTEALTRDAERFCIGLPPPCCLREHVGLHRFARVAHRYRTFATLFLHGNLGRMVELVERSEPIVVATERVLAHWKGGWISVPANAVERGCDLEPLIEQMLACRSPMLVSAGPVANVLIDRYWQRQEPAKRQIVLDVGSALDRYLTGVETRYYHHGPLLSHHCTLLGSEITPKSSSKGTPMQISSSSRIVVGRHGRGASTVIGARPQRTLPAQRASGVTANPSASVSVNNGGTQSRCKKCVRVIRNR